MNSTLSLLSTHFWSSASALGARSLGVFAKEERALWKFAYAILKSEVCAQLLLGSICFVDPYVWKRDVAVASPVEDTRGSFG